MNREQGTNVVRAVLAGALLFIGLVSSAAGLDDKCVSFSTRGPDRYSDGSVVLDGECYALVWSADGQFDGFTAGGTCIDPNDMVVLVAPVAAGGRCPLVLFQIPEATAVTLTKGTYAIYLLDTRVSTGGRVQAAGVRAGVPVLVNGYGEVAANVTLAAASAMALPDGAAPEGGNGAVSSRVAPGAAQCVQPRIKAMRLEGDHVFLTVENLDGYMRVQSGADVRADDASGVAVETGGAADETILVAPRRGTSGFYKVIRNR